MALTTAYLTPQGVAKTQPAINQFQQAISTKNREENNRGGFFGGIGYVSEKLGLGLLRSIEGIWDFAAGGIADLLGADAWAERQFKNDWVNYNHADEWYNPGSGWKLAGDVTGGIGTSVPALAVNFIPGLGQAASAAATFGVASTSAAGSNISDAVKQTGKLTGKEWGYGALSGATEGTLETVTNVIGAGATSVIKSFGKNAAKHVAKRGALATGAKLFAGEAFEEGMSEWLNPYYAQITYDPERKNATAQEILYSAFVGGLSGVAMGGAGAVVSNVAKQKTGSNIAARGETESYIKFADTILAEDDADPSDSPIMANLKSARDKLKKSLLSTDGIVTTAHQKRLLGDVTNLSFQASMSDAMLSEALYIINNAEAISAALDQYNYTDKDGNAVRFNAEDLRKGLSYDSEGKLARGAVQKALESNIALRSLATQSAAGKLLMDTDAFSNSVLSGQQVISEDAYNSFVESADEATKNAVARELGLDAWSDSMSFTDFGSLLDRYMQEGGADRFSSRVENKRVFEESRTAKAVKKIPARFTAKEDGVRRYEENGESIGIRKDGDTYYIYDYEKQIPSNPLTKEQLNATLKEFARRKTEAKATENAEILTESAAKPETVSEEGKTQKEASATVPENETTAKEKTAPQKSVVARSREIAETKVKDYDKLSERNKSMVRKVIRQGILKGIHEELLIDFANVSAHARVDVVFDKEPLFQWRTEDGREVYAEGAYEPHSDTIYINPDVQTSDGILIHELDHAIRKTVKGGEVTTKTYEKAITAVDADTRRLIAERYTKGKRMSAIEKVEVANDEVEAFYAATVLGSKNIVKHLVSDKPSLKQRILDFFKGAEADYRDVPNLDRQAAKYYRQYKKWFDEYAGNRRYKTMGDVVSAVESGSKRYSIVVLSDGKTYVKATRNVITGTTRAEQRKEMTNFFRVLLKNKPSLDIHTIEGDVLTLTMTETADKARDDFKTVKGKRVKMSDDEFALKTRIESHIDEVSQISERRNQKTDSKGHGFARDGFTYRRAYFRDFDGKYYEVVLSIGNDGTVATVYNVGKTKESVSPSAKIIAAVESKLLDETLSNSIIPDPAGKINPSDKNSSEKSSEPVKDSLGNTMTKEQADYFKDSKVRDKDGNLLAMYQGSAEEFYTFDRKKSKPSNLYGRGFYFTNSEDQARHYGKTRAFYLGVNNPVSTTERTISRAQMRKFLEAVAENEDYSIENYGTYDVAKVLSSVYDGGRSDFAMLQDVNATAIGDLVEAIELFNDINDTTYDGIILDTEAVTFRSNQAKLVSNKKPTVNPDMRMSLPDTDIDGKALTPEQQSFFAESAIKAVQDDGIRRISPKGSLMPVYHGTNTGEFYEFDINAGTSNDAGWYGKGFYFAFNKGEAEYYGKRVLKCYLNIKNPFVFDDEMQVYDGVTSGDVNFDFASFVLNMAEKFPDIAKKLTIDVAEHSGGDSSEVTEKNFVDLATELKEIYDSKRLSIVKVYDDVRGDHYEYRIDNDVGNMDIPAELKKVIQEQGINSAYWADYLRKEGKISEEQYEDILDAMEKYGETNFETVYLYSQFETRKKAEAFRLSAALQYLSEKKYSYLEQHIPEHFMMRIGNEFSAEIQRRGYDGVLQSLYGDEVVAFNPNQIKLTTNKNPTANPDMRFSLPESDTEYLSAVERGDMETAQRMVDETAKKAGYTIKAYHGTPIDGITVFDASKIGSNTDDGIFGKGFYFSTDSMTAGNYATKSGTVMPVFLAVKNPWWGNAYKEIGEVAKLLDMSPSALTVRKSGISKVVAPVLSQSAQFSSHLAERGYDAVVVQHGKNDYEVSVFDNKQIKSADPVTYDDNGNVIPLSKRFDATNSDIRFSLPADTNGNAVEFESITEPSIPQNSGYRFTVGQMQKRVADLSHYKVYSKKDILGYVKHMTGVGALADSEQSAIADNMWQFFNSLNGDGSRDKAAVYANDMARYIVSRSLRETNAKKPVDEDAQRRFDALSVYIGRLTFTKEYLDEIRHTQDKDGMRRILGRWGYKGVKRGTERVPMDVFVTDVAREMPELSDLEEMHPADAFVRLNEIYDDAKKRIGDKWQSAIEDIDDVGIENMIEDLASEILATYEYSGDESAYARRISEIVKKQRERANYWKIMYDRSKQGERLRNLVRDKARRIRDLKTHKYSNATQIDNDTLDSVISKLGSIYVQGTLSVPKTREACTELLTLYKSKAFRESVLEYYDESRHGYYNEWIEDALEVLSGQGTIGELRNGFINAKAFEIYELKMLNDVMSYFIHLHENYGKVWKNGQLVDALPEAERYIKIAQENSEIPLGRVTGFLTRMFGSKYAQFFSDPASVVRRADLYNEHGFFTEMFNEIRSAAYRAEVENMKILTRYDEFLKKNKSYMQTVSKETVEFQGVKIPKIVLISLYCSSKRSQLQAGLAINGFSFVNLDGKTVRVDGRLDANAKYTEEQIVEEIVSIQKIMEKSLTDLDRQYIGILEEIYNKDARRLKMERDYARQGFTNVSEGYYYPGKRANIAKSVDNDLQGEIDRVSNASFNKDVVKGAKQELFIESADKLLRRHVYAVCQYAYLSPVVDAFNRVYNIDTAGNRNRAVSVQSETRNAWVEGDAYMRKLIKDVQGISDSTEGSSVLSFIRGGYAISALGANPKVLATQLSSFAAASGILDVSSIVSGISVSGKDVGTYCNLALLRRYENTAAMAQAVVDRRGQAKGTATKAVDKTRRIGEVLMTPIGLVDGAVIRQLFGGCQVQVEKDSGGKLKVGSERNKIEAGKLLERVIFETQQNTLSTERSAAMRSGNEIYKALTMFSADAMKLIGRLMDSFGELFVLKAKKASVSEIKAARKNARKATTAFIATAVYMTALAELFKLLYRKEEEKSKVAAVTGELFGNMLGGLPVIRDVYSLVLDGYEIDHYAYSAVNDMVKSMTNIVTTVTGFAKGEKNKQEIARSLRQFTYAVSNLLGVPVRNASNVIVGLTRRVSQKAGYMYDNAFYEKNYANDFSKAIEDGDDEMAIMLYEMLYNERVGSSLNKSAVSELHDLAARGNKVLPKPIGNTVTVDGEEYELSEEELAAVKSVYSNSLVALDRLFSSAQYQTMSDEDKTYAANYMFGLSKDKAMYTSLGFDRGNAAVLARFIPAERLAIYATKTRSVKGEQVSNENKRKKIVSLAKRIGGTAEEKMLLIYLKGYSVKDGDFPGISADVAKDRILRYILSLRVSRVEKEKLAKMCGFEVKNGKITK